MPPRRPTSDRSLALDEPPARKRPIDDDDDLSPAKRTRSSGIPPLEILIEGAPGATPSSLKPKRRRLKKEENEMTEKKGNESTSKCASPMVKRARGQPTKTSPSCRMVIESVEISSPLPQLTSLSLHSRNAPHSPSRVRLVEPDDDDEDEFNLRPKRRVVRKPVERILKGYDRGSRSTLTKDSRVRQQQNLPSSPPSLDTPKEVFEPASFIQRKKGLRDKGAVATDELHSPSFRHDSGNILPAMHEEPRVVQDSGRHRLRNPHSLECSNESQLTVRTMKATSSPTRLGLNSVRGQGTPRSQNKMVTSTDALLTAQKRACLAALRTPSLFEPEADDVNAMSMETLLQLLQGTVYRGEGNSCLVLGPRESGKTRMVEETICSLEGNAQDSSSSRGSSKTPIVIRLSGHTHLNDKLALNEIGRQIYLQTGSSQLAAADDGDLDPSHDFEDEPALGSRLASILPPPALLPTLVTTMASLPRPTIVILDAFDLFMAHARQALLYCLLDTVQSCRAGEGRNGVAVIGVTSRVDCLNLLEKRVKSRFSHRIIKWSPPCSTNTYTRYVMTMLKVPINPMDEKAADMVKDPDGELEDWRNRWDNSVDSVLNSKSTQLVLKQTFELIRSLAPICRIFTAALLDLNRDNLYLTPELILAHSKMQRSPDRFPFLYDLSYPCLGLLIASEHARTAGHDAFTFEYLFDLYTRAAKQSASLNVSLDGVSIGLLQLSREILTGACDDLITLRIFLPSGPTSTSTSRQYIKYRCEATKEEVRNAVERRANTQLKRWLQKPA
ncbi:origin recognition complex subunit 4 C-terminus-domain-containing protein [Cantharellus anzutake]|uniref:origin recognition complex subunit 4 C-terminus-domain-containing protein n=1 Tax=Cantharellus anzutake TaxID=1750568 RepID=UPI001907EF48|nr:origin recognition complex subunit 4 C-terminus-domain-containing protein [Cantharellus anzutake]KAF8338022.1 origin recognition complex subunit 4 C-terminus-domain-containing protein [Cantharellus anzutake]